MCTPDPWGSLAFCVSHPCIFSFPFFLCFCSFLFRFSFSFMSPLPAPDGGFIFLGRFTSVHPKATRLPSFFHTLCCTNPIANPSLRSNHCPHHSLYNCICVPSIYQALPLSYCPISLLATFGKLFGKILLCRILSKISCRGFLHNE